MKKVMLVGRTYAGKTTLCQYLRGEALKYKKTQAIEILGKELIDTPGEYLERRGLYRALQVTSTEADVIIFVQDATADGSMFAPMFTSMFTKPVIGVVTKCDAASEEQIVLAKKYLEGAGAKKIFLTSAVAGEGMEDVIQYLEDH